MSINPLPKTIGINMKLVIKKTHPDTTPIASGLKMIKVINKAKLSLNQFVELPNDRYQTQLKLMLTTYIFFLLVLHKSIPNRPALTNKSVRLGINSSVMKKATTDSINNINISHILQVI